MRGHSSIQTTFLMPLKRGSTLQIQRTEGGGEGQSLNTNKLKYGSLQRRVPLYHLSPFLRVF